jgi:hypothetical protein
MQVVPAMLHLDAQAVLLDALRRIDEDQARELVEEQPAAGELRRIPPVPPDRLGTRGTSIIISTYNEALRRLFSAIGNDVKRHIQEEVKSFMARENVAYAGIFHGVEIRPSGLIDPSKLADNVGQMGSDATDHLQVGLSELLFFVLFAAGDAVDEQAKAVLHQRVAEAMHGLAESDR